MLVEEEIVWIKKIKKGHTKPFRDLYSRHHGKLFSLCFRFTGNTSDAEDQLQEIFIKILDKIESFRGQSSFATWAHRLATNHLINFTQRRPDRREDHLEVAAEGTVDQPDVALAMALKDALATLPEGFRKVFILHDQEGYKHEEIAEMLGITAGTSRSQLTRARLALRDKLKPMLSQRSDNCNGGKLASKECAS